MRYIGNGGGALELAISRHLDAETVWFRRVGY